MSTCTSYVDSSGQTIQGNAYNQSFSYSSQTRGMHSNNGLAGTGSMVSDCGLDDANLAVCSLNITDH